jgi:hypothetical protein
MKRSFAVVIAVLALAVALVAIPAGAHNGVFQANLTTGAELHDVVDSNATGHATFRVTEQGLAFTLKGNRLSGPVWGAHIHGAAGPDANAGILVGLCGAPPPAPAPECTMTKPGKLRVESTITHDTLAAWGITADELMHLMQSGMAYVNVHTDANPAGEVRGQVR